MDRLPQLVDGAIDAIRERILEAVAFMGAARDPGAFTEAERRLVALAHDFAADMTERVLQEVSDDSARKEEAASLVRARAAKRGIELKLRGSRPTPVRTLGGQVITVNTPYAKARPRSSEPLDGRGAQGTGVYPVLDQLGITGRTTPALRLFVSRSVSEANSVSSARELMRAAGVDLGHKMCLRMTYEVSDTALSARAAAVRGLTAGDDGGEFAGRRVVVAVDGGRINIRRRVAGRPKKGGRKRFETEWREPKVLTIYVLDADGKRDRKMPSVIDGTLGDADAVFELLRYHLRRLGAHAAEELTLIGDGAKWIWNRAEGLREDLGLPPEHFHEIVDYFHAVERLSDFAKSRVSWSAEYRSSWMQVQKERLKSGRIEEIEATLRQLSRSDPEGLAKERPYWSRNRERLRFAAYRARGLPLGSGAVESAVRRVVNLRLKGASITWTEQHAEGVLHLRAYSKAERWAELEKAVLSNTGWRPRTRQPRSRPAA